MKKAEALQAANPHAAFGANKFADMSEAEFASNLNGAEYFRRAMATPVTRVSAPLGARLAVAGTKVDWREKGGVTAVKSQGACGACWAFSTIGNIEGAWFAAGNPLTPLSVQELTSCDSSNSGCNGGLMDNAFKWILEKRRGEIVTEESYPYESGRGGAAPVCKSDEELDSLPVGAVITGYTHLERSEDTLAAFVAQNPVSVAVDATSFQSYVGGILTNCINRQINHGVLAVGFDSEHVPPYWIVKNTWGQNWGEAGFVRIAKGSNQCLINEYATTAIVKK